MAEDNSAQIAKALLLQMERLRRGRCHEFVTSCRIVREDESVGLVTCAGQQLEVLDAWEQYRQVYVTKYRQAKISTAIALALLGMVEYTEGIQGVFLAEAFDTAETVWNRASYAYQNQHPKLQVPLHKGTGVGSREIRFAHNGAVKVLSGSGDTPAIGNSPDRLVVTEYPDVKNHENFNAHVFPTVNKRPNARVLFESTPGLGNTIPHTMWLKALAGEGRFHPVFLKWWLDPSIRVYDEAGRPVNYPDFTPTQEELRLAELMPGITPNHFMFRRLSLDTEFADDVAAFDHKYPKSPLDGWPLSTNPVIPQEVVQAMFEKGIGVKDGEFKVFAGPDSDPAHPYVITADPAGFGDSGDPSAFTVWSGWEGREVASWSAREDPTLFADRLIEVQKLYGTDRTLLVVESNKGECVAALRSKGARNLWMHSESHPGYFASELANAEAMVALVDQLRRNQIRVYTKSTLAQLLAWDGKGRQKRSKTKEGRHHYDRAVTVRMFAHIRKLRNFGTRPAVERAVRGMTAAEFDKMFSRSVRKNVLGVQG